MPQCATVHVEPLTEDDWEILVSSHTHLCVCERERERERLDAVLTQTTGTTCWLCGRKFVEPNSSGIRKPNHVCLDPWQNAGSISCR